MSPKEGDRRFDDERLLHEEGVLASPDGGHRVGCDEEYCAPDEYVEDPVNEPGVPGTPDDLPYDYGVETQQAADEILGSVERPPDESWGVGDTGSGSDAEPKPLGSPEERELWSRQQPLIEESQVDEREYAGLADEDIRQVVEAGGEDAEEVLPQAPDGVSATGSGSE